jgi:Zn-dependent protease
MNTQEIIVTLALSAPGFLTAIVFHEWAHAFTAKKFGDDTADRMGRLTLNPMAHYDLFGTVLFPLICVSLGATAIGWAKPVPIDTRNFKQYKKGVFWVSFAGPLSNMVLAFLGSFFQVFLLLKFPEWEYTAILAKMLSYLIMINVVIGVFNLIPLPPLDGSRMLIPFLSFNATRKYEQLAQYTPYIFLGIMALSFMGIHVLSVIFIPAYWVVDQLRLFFFQILQLI